MRTVRIHTYKLRVCVHVSRVSVPFMLQASPGRAYMRYPEKGHFLSDQQANPQKSPVKGFGDGLYLTSSLPGANFSLVLSCRFQSALPLAARFGTSPCPHA